jgi:GH24 family phage-related lysozyme (muramidase)
VSAASDITAARIVRDNEEGFSADVYDDATGMGISVSGQPTIGYGTRCRQWSKPFAQAVMCFDLSMVFEPPLLQQSWYVGCDNVRRSALLEIAENQGVSGLLNGYPKLIAAIAAKNWPAAQAECTVKNENVKARYVRLGQILLSGIDA